MADVSHAVPTASNGTFFDVFPPESNPDFPIGHEVFYVHTLLQPTTEFPTGKILMKLVCIGNEDKSRWKCVWHGAF